MSFQNILSETGELGTKIYGLNSVSDPLIQTLFLIRVDRFPFQLDNKQLNQIRVEKSLS